MRNLRLDICYEGTKYSGWQRLPNTDNTIQAKLETTLSRLLDEPIEIVGSGRTDAGTHAVGQVVNFHCESKMPCEDILNGLRMYLPKDIGVYSCKNVSERFHARYNAKTKTYRYRVWNSMEPCVFERNFVYIDRRCVDLAQMREAAKVFIGTHDFSAFCGNRKMKKSTVRTIHRFDVEVQDHEIVFFVNGNGFLQHMVRILVGTILEVGRGERSVESLPSLFGGERCRAGEMVPSTGLCLMEVTY